MSSEDVDFIKGYALHAENKGEQDLSLGYAYPTIIKLEDANVLVLNRKSYRKSSQESILREDGLYVSDNPFIYSDIEPQLDHMQILEYQRKHKFSGKLVKIVLRKVDINTLRDQSDTIEITSVYLLFKNKVICKTNRPFNRKLHKLLIKNSECNNLFIQVHAKGGQSSILPLPLPKRNVENNKVDIDFAISDNLGRIHGGTVTCTITLNNYGTKAQEPYTTHFYKLSNDPNDPQIKVTISKKVQVDEEKSPDIVVIEQPAFSLFDISFGDLFQAKRPLELPTSTRRHHAIGKTILTVNVLRGIEIPIREESALVQPFVEVEWGNTVHATVIAEGPAPVWQQTMHFELPKQNDEYCIKFRLYDQHPVWGQQWLGETRIPIEHHRNYQELERWITLSTLFSPLLLFGYVQASPGQSYTRIYVLIKMEHPSTQSMENTTVNTLLKGIPRCLVTPYKINDLENAKDVARLAMLIPSLPTYYGPVTPRQALNIKKVDHYGRAALLASLLQGLSLQTYVLLGSSQISKWTAFVLSISENGIYTLWDPETGNYHKMDDSHCPLMKVSRLINHFGMWENLQKSILPHNLKYDVKSNKDWRPIESTSAKSDHTIQVLELSITDEEVKQFKKVSVEMEQHLKDKLAEWRSIVGLTTIFNRHATTVLRNFILKIEPSSEPQLDKRDLKQLHRAYHIHGFVLNKRDSNKNDLTEQLNATKIHNITGPIEFALVCHIQPYVGKICSMWLAVIILRSRD
ncbi:Coiled-coil and C2 domain-containing protein 2A [Dufourea novaeangliae]|uniref:Coiled-coil and C2 domain-containing protein 2A n=1 Tax=Dufourea novaeangliae TaxID=178035 RepID=A0A154NW03_DUFNO|nr:Coiled-coil and C2 domain-containing protein 2A [Dufourea novaeangliae]